MDIIIRGDVKMKDIKMVYSTEFCKTVIQFSNEENYKNKREHYVQLARTENASKCFVEFINEEGLYTKQIIFEK